MPPRRNPRLAVLQHRNETGRGRLADAMLKLARARQFPTIPLQAFQALARQPLTFGIDEGPVDIIARPSGPGSKQKV